MDPWSKKKIPARADCHSSVANPWAKWKPKLQPVVGTHDGNVLQKSLSLGEFIPQNSSSSFLKKLAFVAGRGAEARAKDMVPLDNSTMVKSLTDSEIIIVVAHRVLVAASLHFNHEFKNVGMVYQALRMLLDPQVATRLHSLVRHRNLAEHNPLTFLPGRVDTDFMRVFMENLGKLGTSLPRWEKEGESIAFSYSLFGAHAAYRLCAKCFSAWRRHISHDAQGSGNLDLSSCTPVVAPPSHDQDLPQTSGSKSLANSYVEPRAIEAPRDASVETDTAYVFSPDELERVMQMTVDRFKETQGRELVALQAQMLSMAKSMKELETDCIGKVRDAIALTAAKAKVASDAETSRLRVELDLLKDERDEKTRRQKQKAKAKS